MTLSPNWKDNVRAVLPWKVYWTFKRIREEWKAWIGHKDLTSLAKVYQTDKWGSHFYTPIYEQWFASLRYKPVRLLEIGVGGYERPLVGGDSLRMWKRYFEKGIITGIDLYDKSVLREHRINVLQGDQCDALFLEEVSKTYGPFDIIIDDGSHVQSHIIASFEALFPLLPAGGIYVVEDTQTSYWPKFEGSTVEMESIPSAMNYFIQRVHAINRSEWLDEGKPLDIPNQGIGSIAFYHNLIFVVKK